MIHLLGFSGLFCAFVIAIGVNLVLTFGFKSKLGSQSLDYHYHLDTRKGTLLGLEIPNFFDVVSNGIFALVGLLGFMECVFLLPQKSVMPNIEKSSWYFFFLSFFTVSMGSAYYHFRPNNWTLVWDRLPMTFTFMAMYFISQKKFLPDSQLSLYGNMFIGIISMLIWYFSLYLNQGEINKVPLNYLGNNDGTGLNRQEAQKIIKRVNPKLRDQLLPYYIVQFYPLAIQLYMLVNWPAETDLKLVFVVTAFICYMIAKGLEGADLVSDKFYKKNLRGIISGHSLKHLVAGFGMIPMLIYIWNAK